MQNFALDVYTAQFYGSDVDYAYGEAARANSTSAADSEVSEQLSLLLFFDDLVL